MSDLRHLGRTLVIAPHPDDEILGCGGTMARLVDAGVDVIAAIMTTGLEPAFAKSVVERVAQEARAAHSIIGTTELRHLDLPAAALDTLPASDLNARFAELIDDVKPSTVFVPFVGDIHLDHQLVFTSAMVAARPRRLDAPSRIYAYETLSETNWYAPGITPAFVPNVFIDISATLHRKLDAFRAFESQIKPFPDERSLLAIESLARIRGAAVFREAAEGFMLIRQID
ncbi:LmbE family N-acetylglucosaminyl deacetylase [Novosphingobium hassiacum]|uniref:LmbE family N-acetylglucosaminyl deacetylase n=1 Tax=Novosphingobium hassiacum TaxID=173676 RepID=A0A7W5ZYU1_9SPHN|nr:PIG-L deacetylase family protein [Novosphingobium hassiacum]MBB3862555.1 LmbE family N-acetylglucosaminyl deacetylase [Novosphingobium hassiacum]